MIRCRHGECRGDRGDRNCNYAEEQSEKAKCFWSTMTLLKNEGLGPCQAEPPIARLLYEDVSNAANYQQDGKTPQKNDRHGCSPQG